ncbi:MAG: ABC transporter ATP-binding protein [Candidatus Acidifodinimicrobium sp.]
MRIAAYNLRKTYESGGAIFGSKIQTINNISIKIRESQVVSLVGENGSGKTTLGLVLSLLLKPDSGQIFFDVPDWVVNRYEIALLKNDTEKIKEIEKGYSVFNKSKQELVNFRKKIGVLFQDVASSMDPRQTVYDIIREPMLILKYSEEQISGRINELKKDVGIDEDLFHRYPHELSDGQRQKIGIARAIATNPVFLFLDEPTSNLDPINQRVILDILKRINSKTKISMLITTHNIALANYIAGDILVMFKGDVEERGPTREIINNPQHPYTKELTAVAARKANYDIPYYERPYNSEVKGCVYHRVCPVSFEICGWDINEVAIDLKRTIEPLNLPKFKLRVEKDKIILRGINKEHLIKMINQYKNKIRSLYAIKEIKQNDDLLLIDLFEYKEVKDHKIGNAEVKCHLFEKDVSTLF